MSVLSLALLAQFALSCPAAGAIPNAFDRVAATAEAESGLQTTALHDNTTDKSYLPLSDAEAIDLATTLRRQGHSVDAGIMQINDANWQRLGLTAETVFDPRRNVCGAMTILAEAYVIERRVSCRYNTGRPDCANGYPERIDAALGRVRVQATEVSTTAGPTREPFASPISINPFVRHGPVREMGFVPQYAARSATPERPDSLTAELGSRVGKIVTTGSLER